MSATDPARHVVVRCGGCALVWSAVTLPMGLNHAAKLMQRARCPRCDAGPDRLFMATEEQAQAWAREQDTLAARLEPAP